VPFAARRSCRRRPGGVVTGVETGALIQPVKRNMERFPADFMAQERAMLSVVPRSHRAVLMSILIMRAFVRLSEIVAPNKDLAEPMAKLERGNERTASVIEIWWRYRQPDPRGRGHEALPPATERRIGFRIPNNND